MIVQVKMWWTVVLVSQGLHDAVLAHNLFDDPRFCLLLFRVDVSFLKRAVVTC